MEWLKKDIEAEVTQELEYSNNVINKTDAYEVEIKEAYISDSKVDGSKSKSLVISVETKAGETARTYFTLVGKDGNTYFTQIDNGEIVKKQYVGLSIVNTLFCITLGKEIFEVDSAEVEYSFYDQNAKERRLVKGNGFPNLIGKKVGITAQMNREIDGIKSKEYASIEHFFDLDSGLFYGEEAVEGKSTKLEKWLASAKDFKEIVKKQVKSSFAVKKESIAEVGVPARKGWGKR